MHKRRILRVLYVGLMGVLMPFPLVADSLFGDVIREIEELRMQQLKTIQATEEIAPFATDGCSGNLSQNWQHLAANIPGFDEEFGAEPPWESCCLEHDKAYWRGSVDDGYRRRLEADQALEQCVIATGANLASELSLRYSLTPDQVRQSFAVIADLMYKAVRIGGQPCSLLSWRWGYGWPNCAFVTISDVETKFSDVKADEQLVFFNTAGWLDPDNKHWNLPVHAWIYEPADSKVRKAAIAALLELNYDLRLTPDTAPRFHQRVNLLLADNERGKRLVVRIAGRDVELPLSEENGRTSSILRLPADTVSAFAERGRMQYFAVTPSGESRRFEAAVQLISNQGISVISDIDDTIKITQVTDHKRLFDNTFFKPFRAVPGMPELYQRLAQRGVKIHFVSSSPWQLYDPLESFIATAGFPWATLDLKAIRFRDETVLNLFKKGTETKPGQIEPILRRYPGRKFILIGDSGEQDPEVYGDIARRYPAQVLYVLVRNADDSAAKSPRYASAFKGLARNKWRLFKHPEELSMDDFLPSR